MALKMLKELIESGYGLDDATVESEHAGAEATAQKRKAEERIERSTEDVANYHHQSLRIDSARRQNVYSPDENAQRDC